MRAIASTFIVILAALGAAGAQSQHLALDVKGTQDEMIGIFLPKIAVAPDGSYGIVAEALFRTPSGREVLRILAQRYSAEGGRVGPTHVFVGESCLVGLDIWLFDYMERPEVVFHPNGTMLVLMQHTGELQIGTDGTSSSEITFGGIAQDGSLLDLSQYDGCVQAKLIFVGGSRQDRPRFDITPNGEIVITADGFFDRADLRNVAIRLLDANGETLVEQVIPHVDANSSQSFHMHPEIAANSSLLLSAWHRCPLIDNQGNAEECDIEVQFAGVGPGGLTAIGGNQRVNAGDPPGTINVYPAAAMNAAGQSVVAWADGRDGLDGEIYAQRFNANGQPEGGNFKVSGGQGSIDSRPEVAILQNGRFMIVWTDSSSIGYRARGRTFDVAGTPEGPALELAPGRLSGDASVAPDGDSFAYIYLAAEGNSAVLESNKSSVVISADDAPHPERRFSIAAAYPNPFVDEVSLTYQTGTAMHVLIRMFDVLGREIHRMVDAAMPPGEHHVNFDGSTLAPGLYLLEIQAGTERQTISLTRAH